VFPGRACPCINEFLPGYDFSASYDIRVQALAGLLYERLLGLDFNKIVAGTPPDDRKKRKTTRAQSCAGDLRQRLEGTGFVILTEIPNKELVLGVAGRFWRPDGGRCMGLTADDFAGFSRPG
jgi:hypothetical protein